MYKSKFTLHTKIVCFHIFTFSLHTPKYTFYPLATLKTEFLLGFFIYQKKKKTKKSKKTVSEQPCTVNNIPYILLKIVSLILFINLLYIYWFVDIVIFVV